MASCIVITSGGMLRESAIESLRCDCSFSSILFDVLDVSSATTGKLTSTLLGMVLWSWSGVLKMAVEAAPAVSPFEV